MNFQAVTKEFQIEHVFPTPSMKQNKAFLAERKIRSLRLVLGRMKSVMSKSLPLSKMLKRAEHLFNYVKRNPITQLTPMQTTDLVAEYVLRKLRQHRNKLIERAQRKGGMANPATLPTVGSKVLLRMDSTEGSAFASKSSSPKYFKQRYIVTKVLQRSPRNRYVLGYLERPSLTLEGSFPPSRLRRVLDSPPPLPSLPSPPFPMQREAHPTKSVAYKSIAPTKASPVARTMLTRSMTAAP